MARAWFQSEEMPLKQVSDIFLEMYDAHDHNTPSHYTFSEKSAQKLTALQDDFIQEVNDAIKAGNVPPKSKKIDLLQRVAVCLHVFDYTTSGLIEG